MTAAPECSACAFTRRSLRRETRLQENRLRTGRIVSLTEIERCKAELAECAARGHHDAQAGPDARWHRTTHPSTGAPA